MKTGFTKWLFVAFIGFAAAFVSCSKEKEGLDPEVDDDTLEVVFEDAALAEFIKEELDLPATAKITRGDLTALTELNIRGYLTDVSSLKGLEHATELEHLDFGGNANITDLTPIKDLKKIAYLRMNETGVTDLTPISGYTTLTYFNANRATPGITSLAPLSGNANIGTLILRGQPLDDQAIGALSGFTKLFRLNIRSTNVTDLSVLAELMSKGALLQTTPGSETLSGDPSLDLQGLAITNCEVLDPYRDQIVLIEGACSAPAAPVEPGDDPTAVDVPDAALAGYIRAQFGLAADATITRGHLFGLTALDLDDAGISTVTNLEGMQYATELTRVHLGGNTDLKDLTPIGGLEKVTYLRINGTGVTDLSPVSNYTALTYFNANRAAPGITSLEPLSKNTGLQEIIVRGQKLGDAGIKAVENFTKLYRLNARDTDVGNATISVLATLMGKGALLKTTPGAAEAGGDASIDLRGNSAITDWTPLDAYASTSVEIDK